MYFEVILLILIIIAIPAFFFALNKLYKKKLTNKWLIFALAILFFLFYLDVVYRFIERKRKASYQHGEIFHGSLGTLFSR